MYDCPRKENDLIMRNCHAHLSVKDLEVVELVFFSPISKYYIRVETNRPVNEKQTKGKDIHKDIFFFFFFCLSVQYS